MKKWLALVLAALLAVMSLAGCGESGESGKFTAYVLAEKGDTYSLGLASSFKTAFEALGGTVIQETFPANTTNFSDYLQKALDKKADVIFAPNSTTVAANLLKNANDLGVECPILAGDTWESSVILDAIKGTKLEVYCSTFFDETDASSTAASDFVTGFKAWLNANSDKYDMNGGNDIVAAVSALGFDAYNIALKAIRDTAAAKGAEMTSVDLATTLWTLSYDNAVPVRSSSIRTATPSRTARTSRRQATASSNSSRSRPHRTTLLPLPLMTTAMQRAFPSIPKTRRSSSAFTNRPPVQTQQAASRKSSASNMQTLSTIPLRSPAKPTQSSFM